MVDGPTGGRHAEQGRRSPGRLRRAIRKLRAAARGFRRSEHGGVALETAVALLVLVVGFGGLMEIVHASYTDQRMGRAARASARALALNPAANIQEAKDAACATIRRELRLADDYDCGTEWTLQVNLGIGPSALPATLDADVTANSGDMVLVRIGWDRDRWSFDGFLQDANADDALEDDDDNPADAGTVPMVAIGLARCEVALCGQGTP